MNDDMMKRAEMLHAEMERQFRRYVAMVLGVVVFNLLAGGWSVDYLLGLAGKHIPFFASMLIGLVVGEVSVPVAIVVAILHWYGVL